MPYPFTECADCKEEKTGGQQRRLRCRSCAGKIQSLKITGKTHSLEARRNNSIGHGGNGLLENRSYPGLVRWVRLVKERDSWKCAECGYQGTKGKRDVDAHHVIPKAAHPELATVLFNGVTLCKPCHKDIHAA